MLHEAVSKEEFLIRIIDDDADHCEALSFVLEAKGWKTVTYLCAKDFLEHDDASILGCIVLDVLMPSMSGLQLQQILKNKSSLLPIIFLSAHGDIDMAVKTTLDGSIDFLQKPVDTGRLLTDIEKATVLSFKRAQEKDPIAVVRSRLKTLTDREMVVLRLLAEGLNYRQIGERLGISERTVESHRTSISKKLGIHSTEEMIKLIRKDN